MTRISAVCTMKCCRTPPPVTINPLPSGDNLLGCGAILPSCRGHNDGQRHACNGSPQTRANGGRTRNVARLMACCNAEPNTQSEDFEAFKAGPLFTACSIGMRGKRHVVFVVAFEPTAIGFANRGTGVDYDYASRMVISLKFRC